MIFVGGRDSDKLPPEPVRPDLSVRGLQHCFVLKVKHGIPQPSIPLPAVFGKIAALQKEHYSGKRTEECFPQLPPGVFKYGEKWVRSRTLELPGVRSTCHINGRFDVVAELGDSSYAIVDFKTGSPADENAQMYSRQLHAYAVALENPAEDALALSPISKLGLLYFAPDRCDHHAHSRQTVEGEVQWVEIPREDEAFMAFLRGVVELLDGPLPDPEPHVCDWCSYRARTGGLPSCPLCNGPMRLMSGKYGHFWSCLRYPGCRGTRDA